MRSDLAVGIGSKQTPQSYEDGHSATQVSGKKSFDPSDRFNAEDFQFRALNRVGDELTFKFNENFDTPSIVTQTKDILDDYYQRAFSQTDPLGARNNSRLGFDEPFVLREIGDRWGPGKLGKIDAGIVRAGAVTNAARTVADIQRIGKFLLTPRGVGFVLTQEILQKFNTGVRSGVREKIAREAKRSNIGDSSNIKSLISGPEIYRQLDSVGRDVKGTDVRDWRPSSIIGSLALGSHFVRHKIPQGLPVMRGPNVDLSIGGFPVPVTAGIEIVQGVSNFVTDVGGGVLGLLDGTSVAFPSVSLNSNFRGGRVVSAVGEAIKGGVKGAATLFGNAASAGIDAAGSIANAIGDKISQMSLPNLPSSDFNLPFTGRFSGLIDIGKIGKPDFSAVKKAMGSLQADIKNILGKIKPPSIGTPSLPGFKFPKLPDIPSPNITIGNPFKNVNLPPLPSLPKFGGTGGLGLGSFALPSAPKLNFPAISFAPLPNMNGLKFDMGGLTSGFGLNATITNANFTLDLRELGLPRPKIGSNLTELLNSPDFDFESLPSNTTAQTSAGDSPNPNLVPDSKSITNRTGFGYGFDINLGGSLHAESTPPRLGYTTARNLQTDGTLLNYYSKDKPYFGVGNSTEFSDTDKSGILVLGEDPFANPFTDSSEGGRPYALQRGFGNRKFGGEDGNILPLNTKELITSKVANMPAHQKVDSQDGERRLQKYMLADYGSLNADNRYDKTNPPADSNADYTRGIGSPGSPGRIGESVDKLVIKTESGFKSTHADKINLHPYGGLKDVPQINDNEDDFVPLKFRDKVNGKYMIFRSILESISDNSAPEYAEERYIGRPDKVYVYQGATRNVNITFRVMPKSVQELITLWEKLNYLRGLTYPNIKDNRMVAPMMEFTLGDMYDLQPMLLQNLNYTIDTSSTWEIKPGLRLPKFIQVAADMRLLEKHIPKTTGKFYDLDWLGDNELFDGTKDTFDIYPYSDGNGVQSIQPRHTKYNDLWAELNIAAGLSEDVLFEIDSTADEIEALQAERDTAISTLNATKKDIPKSSKELARLFNR